MTREPTHSVTKAAALAAAAEILIDIGGSNPSDVVAARAAAGHALIELGNAIGDDDIKVSAR